jgi:hypothetical protein
MMAPGIAIGSTDGVGCKAYMEKLYQISHYLESWVEIMGLKVIKRQ